MPRGIVDHEHVASVVHKKLSVFAIVTWGPAGGKNAITRLTVSKNQAIASPRLY